MCAKGWMSETREGSFLSESHRENEFERVGYRIGGLLLEGHQSRQSSVNFGAACLSMAITLAVFYHLAKQTHICTTLSPLTPLQNNTDFLHRVGNHHLHPSGSDRMLQATNCFSNNLIKEFREFRADIHLTYHYGPIFKSTAISTIFPKGATSVESLWAL